MMLNDDVKEDRDEEQEKPLPLQLRISIITTTILLQSYNYGNWSDQAKIQFHRISLVNIHHITNKRKEKKR